MAVKMEREIEIVETLIMQTMPFFCFFLHVYVSTTAIWSDGHESGWLLYAHTCLFFYFGTAFQVGEQIAHGSALHSVFHDIYQKSLHVAQALHCVELSWFISSLSRRFCSWLHFMFVYVLAKN